MNLLKVPGRGADNPRVVFIGTSTSQDEERQRKCWSGVGGQLLFQAIKEYGLKPAWVTNVVKAYLPDERDPKTDEIEFCLPHLIKEVDGLDPEIVVTLGNIATRAFLEDKKLKITEVAGQIIKHGKYKVIPVLHPTFVLRYPHNQAIFESQLRVVKKALAGETVAKVPPAQKAEDAREALQSLDGVVAFDFETTGITKHDHGKIRIAGFADKKQVFWTDDLEAVADFLKTSPLPKIAQNVGFEMRACKENFGFWPKNVIADTAAMHYLLDESSPHGLKVLASQFLEAEAYDIEYTMKQHAWTWKTVPVSVLGPYCCLDATYTRKLYDVFRKQMDEGLIRMHSKVVLPLEKVCAKMEFYGIKMDVPYAKKLSKEYSENMDDLRSKFLRQRVIVQAMGDLKLESETFNMNSAHQIRNLFTKLGLTFEEKTKNGLDSVREEAVAKYKSKPFVAVYLEWKKAQTIKNNFIDKFPNFADKDGIVRAHMNPCHVTTGRLSVTNPNMQAIPVDPKIRNMFISRFDKGYMLSFDFKQLEMRLVANESDENRLLDAFKRGDDVHDLTAELLFGKGFSKDQRNMAKRVNFGVVYGAGAGKLVREFDLSWDVAESTIDRFNKSYPKLYRWMKGQKELVAKQGYIVSRFGRMRRLGKTDKLPDWQKAAIERQAGNFPIQSMGADLTNVCLIRAYHEMCRNKTKSKICLQVHDSIVVDTHPSEKDQIVYLLKNIMTRDVPKECSWLKVKIEVDVQVERKWA